MIDEEKYKDMIKNLLKDRKANKENCETLFKENGYRFIPNLKDGKTDHSHYVPIAQEVDNHLYVDAATNLANQVIRSNHSWPSH